MKICPQCNNSFTDDNSFCLNDGTLLANGVSGEQETIIASRINFNQPGPAVNCTSCGLADNENSRFCRKCGTPLPVGIGAAGSKPSTPDPEINFALTDVRQVQPRDSFDASPGAHSTYAETVALQTPPRAPNPTFTPPAQAQDFTPAKSNAAAFIISGVVIGLVIVAGIGWLVLRSHPLEAKLDAAIGSGKLIAPPGDNAYEYYQQLKKDGIKADVLEKYESRLFPVLTGKAAEIIKTVSEPGYTEKRPEEWQDAAKMMEWAAEMRPMDNSVAARALYCRGRVSYLANQRDAAADSWKKAADKDKKWALPLNGIGLINNEQKNYEDAKQWLRQAIEREPGWALPYNNLGSAFYFQKQYAEAAPYYQKAIELSPRWARPHAWLASIALENADYSAAVAEFEKVLAPDALGAGEMNMTVIKQQYEKAKYLSASGPAY